MHAGLGCIWPLLAMFGRHILSQMYVVWSSTTSYDQLQPCLTMLRAKASPEWTNSDRVQLGHLRTMTKLVQLWTVDANRAVCHRISLNRTNVWNITECHKISLNYKISPYLTESHQITPYLTESCQFSPNIIASHHISSNLRI